MSVKKYQRIEDNYHLVYSSMITIIIITNMCVHIFIFRKKRIEEEDHARGN
ncbi:hypothetical protein L3i20_v223840 [Paenibacillus sp. L3-i20]|nr:hypothetical protein L3i20_v223840 [Paenibacillus sp. L3-i20]